MKEIRGHHQDCFACDYPAPTLEESQAVSPREAMELALLTGLAMGFSISQKVTELHLCEKHGDFLRRALVAAGSKPLNMVAERGDA